MINGEVSEEDLKALAVKFREKYGMPVPPEDIGEPEDLDDLRRLGVGPVENEEK